VRELKPFIGERSAFRRVKYDAKRAGREFNITLDFFVRMCHEPCHYCNRRDINSIDVPSKAGGYLLKGFRYNGLDRVDNTIGYEEDNCVPCCVVCNRAKNSMPYADFMEYIAVMVNYQSSVGESNVIDNHTVHSARIPYRGRHRKTGNASHIEESHETKISVSSNRLGQQANLPYGIEWTRGLSGGAYRAIERTVQA
jgi:hypothetical protein